MFGEINQTSIELYAKPVETFHDLFNYAERLSGVIVKEKAEFDALRGTDIFKLQPNEASTSMFHLFLSYPAQILEEDPNTLIQVMREDLQPLRSHVETTLGRYQKLVIMGNKLSALKKLVSTQFQQVINQTGYQDVAQNREQIAKSISSDLVYFMQMLAEAHIWIDQLNDARHTVGSVQAQIVSMYKCGAYRRNSRFGKVESGGSSSKHSSRGSLSSSGRPEPKPEMALDEEDALESSFRSIEIDRNSSFGARKPVDPFSNSDSSRTTHNLSFGYELELMHVRRI